MSADNSSPVIWDKAEFNKRSFLQLLKAQLDGFNQAVEDSFFLAASSYVANVSAMRSLSSIALRGDFVDEYLCSLHWLLLAATKKELSEGALK